MTKDTIWKLSGCVKHYPWGGTHFIPELICQANERNEPFAELWYGQHPSCPSITSGGSSLSDVMASTPETILNSAERKRWNSELPFLCKILDVRDMLSIQIHPDQQQALEGFQREEEEGISPAARKRTFRDEHHKPEIMYALSDFYLLHDFRSDDDVIRILSEIVSLNFASEKIKDNGLPDFYRWFMMQRQHKVNVLLKPFVENILKMETPEDPGTLEYWVKRAIDQFCSPQKIDRGILSFYLLNLVVLRPGEVIFQDSGIPHAYLRGQNIEVMANSDNVIRGGLTSKFINTRVLSQLVRFDERKVHHLLPVCQDESRRVYTPPVEEFRLEVIDLEPYQEYLMDTTHISMMFSTCNCFMIRSPYQELRVGGGEAVLIRSGESVKLLSRTAAQIFFVSGQG